MENTKLRFVGPSFLQLLGLVFIILKLTNVITWSWWLVLLPIWGPIGILLVILIIGLLLMGIGGLYEVMRRK
jgi:hypothetical protein